MRQLHGTPGSVQIYNHENGRLNATEMHFTPTRRLRARAEPAHRGRQPLLQ